MNEEFNEYFNRQIKLWGQETQDSLQNKIDFAEKILCNTSNTTLMSDNNKIIEKIIQVKIMYGNI
jgi:hypothetical protein